MKYWEIEEIYNIVYWTRSGSYLLHSLLEGHPNLLNLPMNNWSLYYQNFIHFVKRRAPLEAVSLNVLVQDLGKELPLLFDDWYGNQTTAHQVEQKVGYGSYLGVNRQLFNEHLYEALNEALNHQMTLTRSLLFRAIHWAYAKSLNRKLDHKNLKIILSLHVYDQNALECLKEDFKDVKVITTIREPISGFDTYLHHHISGAKKDSWLQTYETVFGMLLGSPYNPVPALNCHLIAVKFEDLHRHTEKTMKALADWMHIDWNSCLLNSTLDGKPWWYHTGKEIINGVNPNLKNSHLKILSSRDSYIFRKIFEKCFRYWKYENKKSWKSKLMAFSVCLFPPSLLNRALLHDLQQKRSIKEKRQLIFKFVFLYLKIIRQIFKSFFDVKNVPLLEIKL